jgi:hypothetical protein
MSRIFAFLLGIVVGAVALYWAGARESTPASAPAGLAPKLLTFALAQERASRTGRLVEVRQTFDDAEVSLLANEYLRQEGTLPMDHVSLHAAGNGMLQGRATAHVAALELPVTFTGRVRVVDQRQARLEIADIGFARVQLPGGAADTLAHALAGELALPLGNLKQADVAVAEGSLTVHGVAEPQAQ